MALRNLSGKVSVVVGGTSGIGQGLAVWLAQQGSSVIISGRSKPRAEQVLQMMRDAYAKENEKKSKNPSSSASQDPQTSAPDFGFSPIDMFSLADTKRFAEDLMKTHDRLDYLVITSGIASMDGRTETPEGIDQKLAVHYYVRMALILNLMPILEKTASQDGADVRVMSVLSAGIHSPYANYRQDPELKQNFSIKNAADLAGFYNDIGCDSLAREHQNLTFIHAAPGFVATNWGSDFNPFLKGMVRGLQFFAKSPEACAKLIGPSLTSPDFKGGLRLVSPNGTPTKTTNLHQEAREFVWEHTKEVIARVAQS